MAEKESLMAQYKSVAEQKAVIDQAQEPLLKESNEIKKQIEAFDGQRQEAQVHKCFPLSPHKICLPLTSGTNHAGCRAATGRTE